MIHDNHIDSMKKQTTRQLAECWTQLGIRGEPPHFKQALVRGIAWHLQQKANGGFDAKTRRLLKAAVRNAPMPVSKRRDSAKRKRNEMVRLRTGTTLIRTWRSTKHEVTVLDDGKRFRYGDSEYGSLSEIAREITGAHWSGPRFFGLNKLKGVA